MKLNYQQQWRVSKALAYPQYYRELKTAEEIHAFVDRWNWDWGTEELSYLLENPLCDRATVLLIYCLGAADYYRQYGSREEVPGIHIEGYDLIMQAKDALEIDRFKSEKLAFDPQDELIEYDNVEKKWDHPENIKKPAIGEKIESYVNAYYPFTILEDLSENLQSTLGVLGIELESPDEIQHEGVCFSIEEETFECTVFFGNFAWEELPENKEIEFSLEFALCFGEYPNESRYCQRYSSRSKELSDAIKAIVDNWSNDFLSLFNLLTKQDLYKNIIVNDREIKYLCWSIGSELPNFNPEPFNDAQQILQTYETPIVIKFMPEREMLVFKDDTCKPDKLSCQCAVIQPMLMLLI